MDPEIERPEFERPEIEKQAKQRLPKRYIEKGEFPISQEWMNLQEAPLFWIDLAEDSRLQDIHDNLVQVEERLRTLVGVPLNFIDNARIQLTDMVLDRLPLDMREKILKALRGELGARHPRPHSKTRDQ